MSEPAVPRTFARAAAAASLAAAALAAGPGPTAPGAGDGSGPWFCGEPSDGAYRDGAGGPPASAGGQATGSGPSRDLYCLELLPTSRARGAAGVVQLAPAASPFGAPLTRAGRFRYRVSVRLEGLPDPGSLGDYSSYVAWAAAPTLRPMVRLGRVEPGLQRLGTVAMNKFLVLVTAERTADLEARRGPVVLRAQSPSMRLQPHAVPFGFMRGDAPAGRGAGADAAWSAPPMPPEIPMVPPLRPLTPPVSPFLPSAEPGPTAGGDGAGRIPAAEPREVVRLEDGDTLRLTAGRVRRTVAGRSYVMYGYNGQYPGPLLRVRRGAEITVRFRNRVGLPSTVHWHGVRLENRFDGVPGVTQELVASGETFTYRVRFPDAGIYWYHPHHREDLQQDLGLYGNMLVEPRAGEGDRADGDFSYGGHFAPVNREEVLMLDDLLVAGTGAGADSAAAAGPLVPYGREAPTHALMGRFGNLVLVNGRPRYRLRVAEGEVVRFYLTNVAGTRTFNLSFGDLPVKVVASDLSRYQRPVRWPNVVAAPAERYVVEVRFDEPGTVPLLNRVQALNHVHGNFFPQVDTLGLIEVTPGSPPEDHGAAFDALPANPGVTADVSRYRDAFDRPVDRTLELTVQADSLPFPVGSLVRKDSIYFHPVEAAGTMPRMNWLTTAGRVRWVLRDPATGRENMEIDWRFRVGDVVKVRLRNRRQALHAMQHPIHVHGQRFLVLSRNGRRSDNLVWKDTALVPAGTTTTLLLELTNPGEWMIHCHIAEHLGAGMKATFRVAGPDAVE